MSWESSSQYFTALLQIAPLLKNGLEIEVIWEMVSKPYIDITIFEMEKFWVNVENRDYKYFKIMPQKYKSINLEIEWDASALSYIANYIALHSWKIKINNIWNNSKQWDYKYLDIMKIFWLNYESDWKITILKKILHPSHLLTWDGIKVIDFENMPDVSMSFMIMSIFLPWITKITWLKTLNLKECLRIDSMRNELRKIWVKVESDGESIEIWEINSSRERIFSFSTEEKSQKINIETYNDHRIAMCFWILNTVLWNLNILNPNCVAKTYPKFWENLIELKK
jgi:3-phosphoshikimate 1-carboxyvinyltransferase